jgi:hypothetical protein
MRWSGMLQRKRRQEGTMRYFKPLATAALVASLMGTAAHAETLRYAFQGTLNQLDPYTLNETFTLGSHGNVYEGLTRRAGDLAIEPALAERWEVMEPNRWRFYLRQGVKFHNGNDFHRRRRGLLRRPRALGRLRPEDAHQRRRQGGQGRRPHRRLRPARAQSHPALRVGHLVHHGQGVDGGERRRCRDLRLRHDAESTRRSTPTAPARSRS